MNYRTIFTKPKTTMLLIHTEGTDGCFAGGEVGVPGFCPSSEFFRFLRTAAEIGSDVKASMKPVLSNTSTAKNRICIYRVLV